ncbi:unnamed protein product [Clonostachys rosea f. rosea IK726]|uniref:HMA domain-containing protein n=2 Tax=Bionectria ochroleuca TaxID=29856 RepID=A0A0B7JIZ7_BIOOC|nr:unnamed protein product [Clonostachys rosea f. rosea IK726]
MACCYIAAFCIGQLIKACHFLDVGNGIKYNEEKEELGIDLPSKPSKGKTETAPSSPSSLILSLRGLTCSACIQIVEDALAAVSGVSKVRVSLTLQQAVVIATENTVLDEELMLCAVRDIGYEAQAGPRTPQKMIEQLQYRESTDRLGSTFSHLGRCATILQALSLLIYLVPGRFALFRGLRWCLHMVSMAVMLYVQFSPVAWIHKRGWTWLRGGRLNMNTLTSLSMGLASLLPLLDWLVTGRLNSSSFYPMATGLGLVVVAGKYVDSLSRRSAAQDLVRVYKPILDADSITLYPEMERVPASYLRRGDKIVVEPHTTIPCDCYVLEGSSLIGQAIVTGESLPARKNAGDFLLGGTWNLSSRLVCAVQREKNDSFYTKLVQSAVESSSTSSNDHEFIDTITRHFVAVVMGLAFFAPCYSQYPLIGKVPMYQIVHGWITHTITILTCACPCAISLAIPSAVVAAIVTACGQGIIITGGINTLEKLEKSKTVVFDKTGTLTHAKLDVEDLDLVQEWEMDKDMIWEYACTIENQAIDDHPIARAILGAGLRELGVKWAERQGLRNTRNVVSDSGKGVKGEVQLENQPWRHIAVGSHRYFKEMNITGTPESILDGTKGRIVVLLAVDERYAASFFVADAIKEDAPDVVKQLMQAGYQCGMLTGDTRESAERVSQQLRLPVIQSGALPDEKQKHIQSLHDSDKIVTMVGDGLNDAPSLAAAGVGVGLQKDSTTSIAGGAVVIVNTRLGSLIDLFKIARTTMDQVRFNLYWILAYNVFTLGLAMKLFNPFNISLTPSLAALLMSLSSVFLTMQSFWLRKRLERITRIPGN